MPKSYAFLTALLTGLFLIAESAFAQNVGGFWLGVTYPADPDQAVYNYTSTLTQTGTTLGGTAQTANPNVPFGGVAYVSGQITGNAVQFNEADKNGKTNVTPDVCYWRLSLVYNAADESLTGTYESIINATTCPKGTGGKVELYRIVLKSGDTFCKGSPIDLLVTGKNIRWYTSRNKGRVLATGNTFTPTLTQTTTFYITQTLYQNESPPVPITVRVADPAFTTALTNTDCGKPTGSVVVTPAEPGNWQYALNGGAVQTTPRFAGLAQGSYTVTARNTGGCRASQVVAIATNAGPAVTNLAISPPRCGTANGQITITASGGTAPLTYSIDGGLTVKSSNRFADLNGGTYAIQVHDANGCEADQLATLPASRALILLSADAVSTT